MRKGDTETRTKEIQTAQMEESKKCLIELHQVNNEQQRLAEQWMEEVIQLKLALADKDDELSKSIKRWQMGNLDHVEVVRQLSSERAKLDMFHQKCAALEESHLKQLQEMQEAHRREIFDLKQQFEKELTQQEQRRLREISELEEKSKKQLLEQEKRFSKELNEKDEQLSLHDKMAKFNQGHTDLEEAMKLQLSDKENSLKTTMALLCHQCRVREQQWQQEKQQLEEMLEEQEMTRQWLVLASKMEIHDLQEKILQLKDKGENKTTERGFWRRLTSMFRRQRK